MKHFGDITKLNGTELPIVDIITGGSPCQDLSVAGKRAGLSGERSGLFMDQIRIIKEMRDEDKRRRCGITGADEYIRPRYMVWENVPGAFSSNKGEDFRAVLEETAKVADENAVIPEPPKGKWTHAGCIVGDGWSIAWRVHDAQFCGVPQRRKRICLLADFNGDTAGRILFELQRKTPESDTEQAIVDIGTEPEPEVQSVSKGVPGNIAESREEGQRIAEDTERCAGEAGGIYDVRISSDGTKNWRAHCYETERCRALDTGGEDPNSNHGGIAVVAFEPGAMSRVGGHAYEDVAGTVRANAGDNQQAVVYGIGSYDSNAMKSDNPHSGIYEADTSRTLDLNGGSPACNQGGMAVVQEPIPISTYNALRDDDDKRRAFGIGEPGQPQFSITANHENAVAVVCLEGNGSGPSHKGNGFVESDIMYTLNSTEHHAVCIENHPADSRVKVSEDGVVQTLSSRMGTGGGNVPMVMESQTFQDIASCLSAADGTKGVHSQMMKNPEENFVLSIATKQISQNIGDDVGMTLCGNDYKEPQVVCVECNGSRPSHRGDGYSESETMYTLNSTEHHAVAVENHPADSRVKVSEDGVVQTLSGRMGTGGGNVPMVIEPVCVGNGQLAQARLSDKVGALNCIHDQQAVMTYQDRTGTVDACIGKGTSNQLANNDMFVANTSVVRRLTPLEAERLQGFPDNWTNIGDWVDSKGKRHKGEADSPRYKALGNSIALPFWKWMAKRMVKVLNVDHPTMASLFDGIGGFPISFSEAGCTPVWASEVEDFCIAVTKKHFPDIDI